MEFRPRTIELYLHCFNTQYCTDCKYRAGCPIRYSFYNEKHEAIQGQDFEIILQSLELLYQKYSDEETVLKASNAIRWKFHTETIMHPYFSYL